MSEFDKVAADYDALLERGLAATGETKQHFAAARIQHLALRLRAMGVAPSRVLDYGCGRGDSIPLLRSATAAPDVLGVDNSPAQIAQRVAVERVLRPEQLGQEPPFDLVYCNGVFHHVEPAERQATLHAIRACLAARGLFALFENNPLNPGTRLVMSRIPFDRDAKPLLPWEATRRLVSAGFEIVHCDFLFFFPRPLRRLRGLERFMKWLPLGGQYLVLARRGGEGRQGAGERASNPPSGRGPRPDDDPRGTGRARTHRSACSDARISLRSGSSC